MGRLLTIVTARGAISSECATAAPVVSRYDYEYDPNGNRIRQMEQRSDYGYDDLDRLVGVKYPDDTAVLYHLDPVGNRRGERRAAASKVAALTVAAFAALAPADTVADVTATFNRADWLLARGDGVDPTRNATLGWDLNGNLVSKETASGTRSFRWDARNTLTAVLGGGVEVGRYDYGANGLRVKRRTSSEDVEYVLDDRYVLQEARGGQAGHPSYRRYHYADGPLAVDDAAGRRFISTDALGSPTDLTGAAGAVAAARKYDAWGQYRSGTTPLRASRSWGSPGTSSTRRPGSCTRGRGTTTRSSGRSFRATRTRGRSPMRQASIGSRTLTATPCVTVTTTVTKLRQRRIPPSRRRCRRPTHRWCRRRRTCRW